MEEKRITVKSFSSEAEAHLLRGRLGVEGISATVNRFSRYRAMASGGYQVKVFARDLERARAIVRKTERAIDMDEYVDAADDSYPRCPACRSVNVAVKPLPGRVLLACALLLGLPLLLVTRDWRCYKCGHRWQTGRRSRAGGAQKPDRGS